MRIVILIFFIVNLINILRLLFPLFGIRVLLLLQEFQVFLLTLLIPVIEQHKNTGHSPLKKGTKSCIFGGFGCFLMGCDTKSFSWRLHLQAITSKPSFLYPEKTHPIRLSITCPKKSVSAAVFYISPNRTWPNA